MKKLLLLLSFILLGSLLLPQSSYAETPDVDDTEYSLEQEHEIPLADRLTIEELEQYLTPEQYAELQYLIAYNAGLEGQILGTIEDVRNKAGDILLAATPDWIEDGIGIAGKVAGGLLDTVGGLGSKLPGIGGLFGGGGDGLFSFDDDIRDGLANLAGELGLSPQQIDALTGGLAGESADQQIHRLQATGYANKLKGEREAILNRLNNEGVCDVDINLNDNTPGNMSGVTKVVSCKIAIIVRLIEGFMESIGSTLSGAIAAVLVLYIIIYGLRVATLDFRVQNAKSFFIHIASVALVAYFVFEAGTEYGFINFYKEVLLGGQLELIRWFMAVIGGEIDCAVAAPPAGTNPLMAQVAGVFNNFDCAVSNLVAYNVPDFNHRLGIGLIFVLGVLLIVAAPGVGMLFIFLILNTLLALLLFLLKIILAFIYAVLVLGIVMALAPLFVPMILFDQTKKLFEAWLANMIAYTLQPVIIFAFMAFFMLVTNDIVQEIHNDVAEITVQDNIRDKKCLDNASGISGWFAKQVIDKTCDFINFVDPEVREKVWAIFIGLTKLTLIFIVFYSFGRYIGQLAQELSGSVISFELMSNAMGTATRSFRDTMKNISTVAQAAIMAKTGGASKAVTTASNIANKASKAKRAAGIVSRKVRGR